MSKPQHSCPYCNANEWMKAPNSPTVAVDKPGWVCTPCGAVVVEGDTGR